MQSIQDFCKMLNFTRTPVKIKSDPSLFDKNKHFLPVPNNFGIKRVV